ncbi:MAG: hypothetical protein HYX68_10365 [Planctomycetes bacterium]|jgi:hypothetical protein|nr:hypothetical protein [Planctomycetota bacterium]
MSSGPNANSSQSPIEPSVLAATLSYLIPGLGQIYQGRYGKGGLFMVSLLGMFMLGQAMGDWRNVYIPTDGPQGGRGIVGLLVRWHYGGQFFIGIAAWPALAQSYGVAPAGLGTYQKAPDERELNEFFQNNDKTPDLGWVYTVVAGMLNLLVIYDAYIGPIPAVPLRPNPKETLAAKKEARKEEVL